MDQLTPVVVTAGPGEPTSRAQSIRGRAAWIVSGVLAAALLYWSLRGIEWQRFFQTIAAARWKYVVLSASVTSSTFFLRAARWRILLNAAGKFPLGVVFWANMAGYLGNNFLPARAGELVRTVLISSRSALSKTFVLTTALAERLMDVIAVILSASLALSGVQPKPVWMTSLSAALLAGAIAAIVAVALLPRFETPIQRLMAALPGPRKLRDFLKSLCGEVIVGFRAFHDPRRLAGFALLTVIVWGLDACALIVTAHALGLTLTFPVAVLLLTGLALGSSLPSTPGYVGIYQFVAVTVLPPFGIAKDEALAFIVVSQAVGYLVVLAFGGFGFYRLRRGD